jgi:hypothetical protein
MRSWSAEDAQGAFEMYGNPSVAEANGGREPVRGLAPRCGNGTLGFAVVSEPTSTAPVGSRGSR